jgi:hypothetical protein
MAQDHLVHFHMSTSTSFLKRIFSARNLTRTAFLVLSVLTLWGILCVEERWRGNRLWMAYRAKAQASGTPLEMKEVIPPAIPDSENFAAIPMIDEIFSAQKDGRPLPVWFAALKMGEGAPALGPGKNGEPMLDQWRDFFVNKGVVAAGADSASTVLAALTRVEPELQQLRQAARRPKSKFPVAWELGIAAPLPHLSALQASNKVFRLSLSAKLANHDTPGALDDFGTSFGIYKAMRNAPALIEGLVRMAMLRSLESALVEDGALASWSDADLRQITSDLSSIDPVSDWQFAIQSERALMNSIFEDLYGKSDSELGALASTAGLYVGPMTINLYPRGWFRLSQIKLNEHIDGMLVVARAVSRKEAMPKNPEHPLFRQNRLMQMPYILFVLAAPAVDGVANKYADITGYHRRVLAACALQRYFLKNGSYPDNLDAIVPGFLEQIPVDPIDGQPMRYRRNEKGGFDIWSIGINRIDDGGKWEPQKPSREQADWVLQVPGKS